MTPLCSLLHMLFKRQLHVFAGGVKIVCHSSYRTIAILKYFCHMQQQHNNTFSMDSFKG